MLTRVLAPIGAVAMAAGLFVPYAAFDPGGGISSDNYAVIDFDDLSYFYVGLEVLVAAIAAAAIPFVLRARVLCGSLLITLGALPFLNFISYVVNPLRGGNDASSCAARPGATIGSIGALSLSVRVSSPYSLRTLCPPPPRQRLVRNRPCNRRVGGIQIHLVQLPSDTGMESPGVQKPGERRRRQGRLSRRVRPRIRRPYVIHLRHIRRLRIRRLRIRRRCSHPAPLAQQSTNGMAVAALVLGILGAWIFALIFGYVGKGQIDKSQGTRTGRGMAIAGIVLGWVGLGFTILVVILVIAAASSTTSY